MPKETSWIREGIRLFAKQSKKALKNALGIRRVPTIVAYRGFGNKDKICIQGHVIEDKRIKPAHAKQNALTNSKALLKRFLASPFPYVRLRVQVQNISLELETDSKGFFEAILPNPDLPAGWHEASVWLTEEEEFSTPIRTQFLIPSTKSIGIISDIDDTFLISHSTNKWRKISLLAFNNAATRKPFDGVASLYQAFCKTDDSSEIRPFFCVSSSEWNLYDFLTDFCQRCEIPQSVLLLQDLKTHFSDFRNSGGGNHEHKLHKIEHIFSTYPDTRFVLLGDSGQKDPELYYKIAKKYPHQIAAIYIRYVKHKPLIRNYIHELRPLGIEMRLFKKSEDVLKDARKKGILV
ncbi:MAG: DUF2183 domain-containing protein [Flammeovirgaceae bacterium]